MLICPRCGSRNEERARFCGNCGSQLSAVVIPSRGKKVRRKLILILGIPLLCLFLVVLFAPKARTPDSTQSTPNDTTAKPAQPKPIEVKVGEDGTVFCPTLSDYDGYRTEFAMWWQTRDSDSEDKGELGADEEVAAIANHAAMGAEDNGCSRVPIGTPMTLENKFQEAGDTDPNDAVANVTMRASDGTTVRGFTEADSLNEQ